MSGSPCDNWESEHEEVRFKAKRIRVGGPPQEYHQACQRNQNLASSTILRYSNQTTQSLTSIGTFSGPNLAANIQTLSSMNGLLFEMYDVLGQIQSIATDIKRSEPQHPQLLLQHQQPQPHTQFLSQSDTMMVTVPGSSPRLTCSVLQSIREDVLGLRQEVQELRQFNVIQSPSRPSRRRVICKKGQKRKLDTIEAPDLSNLADVSMSNGDAGRRMKTARRISFNMNPSFMDTTDY